MGTGLLSVRTGLAGVGAVRAPPPAQEALEEVCVCAGEGSGRDAAQEDRGRSGRRAEASLVALCPVTAPWRADHPAEF